MTLSRSALVIALVAAAGVALAVTLFLRASTREGGGPEVTLPAETSTERPTAFDIDSIDQIVELLESVPKSEDDTTLAFAPTYVPDGFTRDGKISSFDPSFESNYVDDDRFLFLMSVREPFYHPRPELEPGHVQEVMVNGEPAYLVRGDWMTVHLDDESDPFETWEPELSFRVYLNLGSSWYMVSLLPYPMEHGIDERELLKIAASMRPVDDTEE